MAGKRSRGRPKLRWKDTVRRDLKAWHIREEWATLTGKGLCRTRYPAQGDSGERCERESIKNIMYTCMGVDGWVSVCNVISWIAENSLEKQSPQKYALPSQEKYQG